MNLPVIENLLQQEMLEVRGGTAGTCECRAGALQGVKPGKCICQTGAAQLDKGEGPDPGTTECKCDSGAKQDG